MDRASGRTLGWPVGDGSAQSFQEFFRSFEHLTACQFYTDGYDVYNKVIREAQPVSGKAPTWLIESNQSTIRDFLARFPRKSKVVSRWLAMIMLTLKLACFLNE